MDEHKTECEATGGKVSSGGPVTSIGCKKIILESIAELKNNIYLTQEITTVQS